MVKITAHSALAKPIALVQRQTFGSKAVSKAGKDGAPKCKDHCRARTVSSGSRPRIAQDLRYLEPVRISDRVPANDSVESADLQLDSEVEQAAWLQQPAGQPAAPTLDSAAGAPRRGSRQANVGLATVPNMFGDLAGATSTFVGETGASGATSGTFTLPIAGGGSRIGKISENDSPIPRDRVFFSYNHFQNVFQLSETPVHACPGRRYFAKHRSIDTRWASKKRSTMAGRAWNCGCRLWAASMRSFPMSA